MGKLKVRCFLAVLVVISVPVLSHTAWTENRDQDWQMLQGRLSAGDPAGKQVNPLVKSGPRAGGDLIWWFQGIENVECVSRFVDVDGDVLEGG